MRQLNRQERLECVAEYARMLGIRQFSLFACGCRVADFGGKPMRVLCERCRQLDYAAPRHCACGRCDELTRESSWAHRIGDDERVERLRQERREHFATCGIGGTNGNGSKELVSAHR